MNTNTTKLRLSLLCITLVTLSTSSIITTTNNLRTTTRDLQNNNKEIQTLIHNTKQPFPAQKNGCSLFPTINKETQEKCLIHKKTKTTKQNTKINPNTNNKKLLNHEKYDYDTIILVGDSHARHISSGVHETSKKTNKNLIHISGLACSLTQPEWFYNPGWNDKNNKKCHDFTTNTTQWLTQQKPSIIVLSESDMYCSMGERMMHSYKPFTPDPKHTNWEKIFNTELNKFTKTMTQKEHHVILVQTIPTWWYAPNYFAPQNCTTTQIKNNTCYQQKPANELKTQLMPRKIRQQTHKNNPNTSLVDTHDLFCTENTCTTTINNQIAYTDNHHINHTTSLLLEPLFTKAINQIQSSQ